MKNKKFILVLLVFAVVIIGALLLYDKLSGKVDADRITVTEEKGDVTENGTAGSEETEPELQPAPDFTVYDAGGNKVSLSDLVGKPVVINFWASWCEPCRSELGDFNAKYLEYEGEIEFMMINVTDGGKETKEKASTFIESQGYEFPVYYDITQEASGVYGIRSIPTSFFIDAEGHAVAAAQGAIDADTLQRGIDYIY